MTYRFILALIAGLVCGTGAARADGLVINFHIQLQEKNGAAAPALTQKDYVVTLYPQSFDVRTGDTEEYYDFVSRHYFSADLAKKTLISYPLYAIPIANRLEKDRRLQMAAKAASQANRAASADGLKDVDLDMLFGSEGDAQTSDMIKTSLADGVTTFSVEDRRLAAMEMSAVPVPDNLKASYAHFFVYSAGLHPVIDHAVASTGMVVKTLQFSNRDGGKQSDITLTMMSTQNTADNGPSMQNLSPVFTGNAAVDAAIRNTGRSRMKSQQELEAKITGFLQQRDALRAALAAKEMGFMLGGTEADNSAVGKQALATEDPLVKATLAAVSAPPHSTEEFIQHMEQLNKAKEQAPDYDYLIEFMRAGQIRSAFESQRNPNDDITKAMQAALDKIQSAIVSNAWLTAAYSDLGDAYFSSRDPREAWILWELAARLNPNYPGLQRERMFEQHALKDFPEYF